jgi:hypothetical protein
MNAGWRRPQPRLSSRPMVGLFAISEPVIDAAERLLPTFRGIDGDHEGILFLLGVERPSETLFLSVAAPDAEHDPGRVHVSREAVLGVAKAGRRLGMAVLAQIHSHPGSWTEHSLGDDSMVLMPFEGMLSIVVPHYGQFGLRPIDSLGVHQFQGGQWVRCEIASIRGGIRVVPASIDLR